MGQIQWTIALVSTALFTIALIGFAINFAEDNNSVIDISDDPQITNLYTQQKGNISAFGKGSESQYQSIIETTIAPGSQTAQSTGPFAITPLNIIFITGNILQVGYVKIFGTDDGFAIFINTIRALIVFILGLFLYKTLRGFPD